MDRFTWRNVGSALLTLALAITATALLFYLMDGNKKVAAVFWGAAGLGTAMFLSGNPRLVALWGLGLALPLDLSKRFGNYIEKMGGETAFRAEVSDIFLGILLLYLVRDLWTGRKAGLLVPKVTVVWIGIFLLGILSLIAGPFRLTVTHELVRMLKVLVLFLVVANEVTTPARVLHCCWGLLLGMTAQGAVGLVQFIQKKHLGLEVLGETGAGTIKQLADESIRTERAFRAGALMQHPNILGCFLAIVIPLALALFLSKAGFSARLSYAVAMVLGMISMIATMSRSGWLSCAVSVTVVTLLMLAHERSRPRALVTVLAAGAVLSIVCVAFADRIVTRLFESKEGAMLSRYQYIDTAKGMIREKPLLGWGLNTYVWNAYPFTRAGARRSREVYKQWLPPVHNIYFLWTAELGFTGLAAHLLLFAFILSVAAANLRVRNDLLFAINAACIAGMCAILVDGFFSFTWRINSIMRVFWVETALIMAIQHWRKKDERDRRRAAAAAEPLNLEMPELAALPGREAK